MGSKQLTVTALRMYEELLDKELEPVLKILRARDEALKKTVTIEVKRELGLYELVLRKAALEEKLDEVKKELRAKTEQKHMDVNGTTKWISLVDAEVERRLFERNPLLMETTAFRDGLVKEIKLAMGTPEIRAMFDKLLPEVKRLLAEAKRLPALKLKPFSAQDEKVLEDKSSYY